jgi:hypothetical protein
VRLTSVRFVAPPPSLHMLNVLAYSYEDTHNTGVIGIFGPVSTT